MADSESEAVSFSNIPFLKCEGSEDAIKMESEDYDESSLIYR